ncbi:nucleotidyltransferase domain-containing protein [Clostridium sp. DJ247]|nr:nucleotidyltransferase domain-containing protein [Clostridium sp. DJ247]
MGNSQLVISKISKSRGFMEFINALNINNILVFGTVLRDEFNDDSDVDIAILSNEKLNLNDILNLELLLEDMLDRYIDVVDLNSDNLDLFVKISILNTGRSVYSSDENKSLEDMIYKVEKYYRENENFFYFRRLDLLS